MKTKSKTSLTIGLVFFSIFNFAQSTIPGNTRPGPGPFLGWDNTGVVGPLDIRNDFNRPINFSTNTFMRHVIDNGGGGNAGGRALFSNDATGVTPAARLHLHQAGGVVSMLFNNNGIGTGGSNGLEIGISPGGDAFFINNTPGQNFSWYNQGGGGPGSLLGRMRLHDGGVGANTGRLALSDDLPGGFAPQSRLHILQVTATAANGRMIRSDGLDTQRNDWQMYTGAGAGGQTEKFRVNTQIVGVGTGVNDVDVNTVQNGFMKFNTNGAERMRITQIGVASAVAGTNPAGLPNNRTRVSISNNPSFPITRALSLLHIGENFPGSLASPGGWRPWMDVGMSVVDNTDNMYVGMKTNEALGSSAVIAWGDNSTAGNLDKLRVIFNAPIGTATGAMNTANGLEFMQCAPFVNTSLNVNDPRTGFGDFFSLLPVGTIDPGNTVEINSIMSGFNAVANTGVTGSYVGSTGASGLRFRDLTSNSSVVTNPNANIDFTKTLSVDNLGNVVLINGRTSVGNYCSATTTSPLASDFEIPMNIYDYYFSGQGTGKTNVGVGLPCSTILGGKVHSYQLANNWFYGINLGVSVAGRFDDYGSSTSTLLGYGVIGNAQGPVQGYNIGVYGQAANAVGANFAGYFQGDVYITGTTTGVGAGSFSDKNIKTNINTLSKNLEIISKLRPVDYKYDNTYAPQLKLNSHKNYGFIAQEVEAIIPDIVSTTTVLPTFDSLNNVTNPEKVVKALNYDGLIPFAIGGIQELNAKQKEMQANLDKAGLSDAQVKTNVNTFNALAKIKTLMPVQYNFTNANVPQLTFKPNVDYSFVAQQLETVYPELVDTLRIDATYDSLGVVVNPSKVLKTVNYKAMSGLLVRSIQEQQSTIDSLKTVMSKQDSINNAVQQQLASLAALIDGCCHNNNRTSNNATQTTLNQLDIELSDKDAIVLNQNVPNPFAEQTTITYNVPASVGKAQIIFFNNLGQVIQTVDIKTRGKGKVNVFASDLSSGLYNYSLVADGKVIDSKKMVRE